MTQPIRVNMDTSSSESKTKMFRHMSATASAVTMIANEKDDSVANKYCGGL